MIPFRSITELMVMTNSRSDLIKETHELNTRKESAQKNNSIAAVAQEQVVLPNITSDNRRTWIKSKQALKKFFDDLDYNNQNISSYDLTLIKKSEQKNYYDAA